MNDILHSYAITSFVCALAFAGAILYGNLSLTLYVGAMQAGVSIATMIALTVKHFMEKYNND